MLPIVTIGNIPCASYRLGIMNSVGKMLRRSSRLFSFWRTQSDEPDMAGPVNASPENSDTEVKGIRNMDHDVPLYSSARLPENPAELASEHTDWRAVQQHDTPGGPTGQPGGSSRQVGHTAAEHPCTSYDMTDTDDALSHSDTRALQKHIRRLERHVQALTASRRSHTHVLITNIQAIVILNGMFQLKVNGRGRPLIFVGRRGLAGQASQPLIVLAEIG